VKLSNRIDYACRVLAQLGRSYGSRELRRIEDLAVIEVIPANYLVQILNELRNGGLVTARRGKRGGYALARPPEDITLHDIMALIDGAVLELPEDIGGGQSGRRVSEAWRNLRAEFEARTKAITLNQLTTKSAEGMYYI
jgi:Rrf2 family protein